MQFAQTQTASQLEIMAAPIIYVTVLQSLCIICRVVQSGSVLNIRTISAGALANYSSDSIKFCSIRWYWILRVTILEFYPILSTNVQRFEEQKYENKTGLKEAETTSLSGLSKRILQLSLYNSNSDWQLKRIVSAETVGGKDLPHLDSLLGNFPKIQASGREREKKIKEMIKTRKQEKLSRSKITCFLKTNKINREEVS